MDSSVILNCSKMEKNWYSGHGAFTTIQRTSLALPDTAIGRQCPTYKLTDSEARTYHQESSVFMIESCNTKLISWYIQHCVCFPFSPPERRTTVQSWPQWVISPQQWSLQLFKLQGGPALKLSWFPYSSHGNNTCRPSIIHGDEHKCHWI